MINVFDLASGGISQVYPLKEIEVLTYSIVYENGYPVKSETSEKTIAHIQPLSNSDLALVANSTIDSTKLLKFYFLTTKGNRILISKKLEPKTTKIKVGNEIYSIFSLNDRAIDGFICAICALESEGENAND